MIIGDGDKKEYFVTYLDESFLLQGMSLHESLKRWLPEVVLYVICLDRRAADVLSRLAIPDMNPIYLGDVETEALLSVKCTRSRIEYIYTLTPFTFDFVGKANPDVARITYVDADIYFFSSPIPLYDELLKSRKSILMTEHGYAPEYRHLQNSAGRFCVQFLPVDWSNKGKEVVRYWQKKCLEGTGVSSKHGAKVFGDQKYLEDWPEIFPNSVHVSVQNSEMLAPWNVNYFNSRNGKLINPIFFHFHSFRFLPLSLVQYAAGYNISTALPLYKEYVASLKRQLNILKENGEDLPVIQLNDRYWLLRLLWRSFRRRVVIAKF
jgi:hypothetical protein